MYKLIYMGGYNPEIFETVVKFKQIELAGLILDYTLTKEEIEHTKKLMKDNGIKELHLEDVPSINPDVIFLCGYTKILKSELIDKYLFINIHAGILPKWRGFNANCWAILNGENKVGYSIHRVREGLDAGELYKIIDITLEDNEIYYFARNRIKAILCKQLEQIFVDIITGKIVGQPQEEKEISYNCKLKASDAYIKDWNKKTQWLIGLYKVFGYGEYGSGVKMYVNNEEYSIINMYEDKTFAITEGIPGSVINRYSDGSILIKTLDSAIRISKLANNESGEIKPSEVLKIGMRI